MYDLLSVKLASKGMSIPSWTLMSRQHRYMEAYSGPADSVFTVLEEPVNFSVPHRNHPETVRQSQAHSRTAR